MKIKSQSLIIYLLEKFKIPIIYIFFFVLIYNESINIGGVSLSILWKIPLLIYIFIYIIKRKIRKPLFNKYAYGYGLVKLLNSGIVNTTIITISDFSRFITFPLLFDFVHCRLKRSFKVYNLLFHISQFVILSFIPFSLKILHSHESIDASESVLEVLEQANRTSGIFSSTHGASSILALSLVFLTYHFISRKHTIFSKVYIAFLFFIGIWALVETYARGGWVMWLIGTFILLVRKNVRFFFTIISVGTLLAIGISFLMQNNEYFYNRITDRNEKGIKNESDRMGSGRFWFAMNGISFWKDTNEVQEILTGKGLVRLMEYQKQETGLYIYCHNGYVDALAQNGICGFLCLIGFSLYMLSFVWRKKYSRYRRLSISVIIMYIIFQLLQGGVAPYSDLFYVLVLQLAYLGQLEGIKRINYNNKSLHIS